MQQGATPNSDINLIQAFKEGKEHAQRKILDLFHQPILFFAQRLTNDKVEGEDIAAEIFIKLFRKHKDFETLTNIKAFLYISTRNACLNLLNKNKRFKQVSLSDNQEAYVIPEPTDEEPFWITRDLELIAKIKLLVDILPAKSKEVFIRHYLNHEKVIDIARDLGVEPRTVYNHLENARNKIRAGLLITLLLLISVCLQLLRN